MKFINLIIFHYSDVTQIENTNKNAFAKFDKTVGSPSPSAQATLSPTKRDKPGEGSF